MRLSHLSPKDGALAMMEKLFALFKGNLESVPLDRSQEFVALNKSIYQVGFFVEMKGIL